MADYKAEGYFKNAISAQANQPVIHRGAWTCTVQAANDKVFVGKLPAGHRLVPELISLFANAQIAAMNVDLCVGTNAAAVLDGVAITAATALVSRFDLESEAQYALLETIGVDFHNDRDIYLLINSGAATAPAGSKVVVQVGSVAVSSPD